MTCATSRLVQDHGRIPRKENAIVSSHWCGPDRMRAIHTIRFSTPIHEYQVEHPHWRDRILLFDDGTFIRKSSGCVGSYEANQGHFILRWLDWGAEFFELGEDGTLHHSKVPHLEPKSAEKSLCHPSSARLHLGCGPNQLAGWFNLDLPEIDIRQPLPFADETVEAFFLEHVIEHVSPPEAYRFMMEARRCLRPGGVLRLTFPDVIRIAEQATPEYVTFLRNAGWADQEGGAAVRSIVLNHGHLGVWSEATMRTVLESLGFSVSAHLPGESNHLHLKNLEHHGSQIGEAFNAIESCCLEAMKLMPKN